MPNSRSMLLSSVVLCTLAMGPQAAMAQTATESQPKAAVPSATPSPAAQSTPAPTATVPAAPVLNAKELQGLDVFSSGGQQLGKVTNVTTLADGKVKDVEVQSAGFLGMFRTTYVVPAEKVAKKGGRIELSMTSEQAKSLTR